MPSISDAIQTAVNMEGKGYVSAPSSPPIGAASPPVNMHLEPVRSVFLRCPLPAIWKSSPDAQRQSYRGSQIPQSRVMTPQSGAVMAPTAGVYGTSGAVSFGGFSGGSSSSGSSTGTSVNTGVPKSGTSLSSQSVSASSGVIVPSQTFSSTVQIAKSFVLFGISASSPCRVQMYGTQGSQLSDSYRGIDVSPPAGTLQGLICDVVLDTAPYQWEFQDRIGNNGDSPQSSTVYLTLTNIGAAPQSISVTAQYLPLES